MVRDRDRPAARDGSRVRCIQRANGHLRNHRDRHGLLRVRGLPARDPDEGRRRRAQVPRVPSRDGLAPDRPLEADAVHGARPRSRPLDADARPVTAAAVRIGADAARERDPGGARDLRSASRRAAPEALDGSIRTKRFEVRFRSGSRAAADAPRQAVAVERDLDRIAAALETTPKGPFVLPRSTTTCPRSRPSTGTTGNGRLLRRQHEPRPLRQRPDAPARARPHRRVRVAEVGPRAAQPLVRRGARERRARVRARRPRPRRRGALPARRRAAHPRGDDGRRRLLRVDARAPGLQRVRRGGLVDALPARRPRRGEGEALLHGHAREDGVRDRPPRGREGVARHAPGVRPAARGRDAAAHARRATAAFAPSARASPRTLVGKPADWTDLLAEAPVRRRALGEWTRASEGVLSAKNETDDVDAPATSAPRSFEDCVVHLRMRDDRLHAGPGAVRGRQPGALRVERDAPLPRGRRRRPRPRGRPPDGLDAAATSTSRAAGADRGVGRTGGRRSRPTRGRPAPQRDRRRPSTRGGRLRGDPGAPPLRYAATRRLTDAPAGSMTEGRREPCAEAVASWSRARRASSPSSGARADARHPPAIPPIHPKSNLPFSAPSSCCAVDPHGSPAAFFATHLSPTAWREFVVRDAGKQLLFPAALGAGALTARAFDTGLQDAGAREAFGNVGRGAVNDSGVNPLPPRNRIVTHRADIMWGGGPWAWHRVAGAGADNCDRKADTDAEDLQLFHPDEIFSKPCSPGMERRGLRASSTGRRY